MSYGPEKFEVPAALPTDIENCDHCEGAVEDGANTIANLTEDLFNKIEK